MSLSTLRICALSLLALTFVSGVHAQVSRCIDKAGKVVAYGNECPPGTRSEQTGIRVVPAAPATPAATSGGKSLAEKDVEFRKRQAQQQEADAKAQKQAAASESRKQSCESARSYLATLQSGGRISRVDPNTGERVYLSDDQFPKEIATAQRAVEANCKP